MQFVNRCVGCVWCGIFAMGFVLTIGSPSAFAASVTWDATTGNGTDEEGAGTWTTGGTNWFPGDHAWAAGDSATFGAGGSGSYAVDLSGGISAATATIASGATYTIGGTGTLTLTTNTASCLTANSNTTATFECPVVLPNQSAAGIIGLMVNGGATLTMSTLTGPAGAGVKTRLEVNGGTLVVTQSVSMLAAYGTLTVENGGTVSATGSGAITSANAYSASYANPTWWGYDFRSGTVSAPLSGTGKMLKSTSDTVTLTGANNYSGPTYLYQGVLIAGASSLSPNSMIYLRAATNTTPAYLLSNGTMSRKLGTTITWEVSQYGLGGLGAYCGAP